MLAGLPLSLLQNYVGSRIRRFARDFVANLNLRLDEGVRRDRYWGWGA